MNAMMRAQRAYELGRLRVAGLRAAAAGALLALVAVLVVGPPAVVWVLPFVAAVLVAEWRGGGLVSGLRRGALVGLVALAAPIRALRPCCDGSMLASGSCCAHPSACGLVGVVVGLGATLAWPAHRNAFHGGTFKVGAGFALGVLTVTAVRCVGLFEGEAFGLMLGLLAGVASSTVARRWLARHDPPAGAGY